MDDTTKRDSVQHNESPANSAVATATPRRGDREDELNPTDRMGRPIRVPIGKQNRIAFEKRKGYHRHIVNDTKDGENIKSYLLAGYTFVTEKTGGGDARAGADTQIGAPVSRSVGGGIKAFLMEIPEELYNADQAEKQREIDEKEKAIKKLPKEFGSSGFGEVKIER